MNLDALIRAVLSAPSYGLLLATVFCFSAGYGVRFWISRRRFYRRNVYGREIFVSFSSMWINVTLEKILGLLAFLCVSLGWLLAAATASAFFYGR